MRAELLIRKRIWKLMVVLTALFGAIVARIISLTVIQGEALTARGVRQWTQEGKVEARRGSIVDRNGETLALSTTAYIVSVNPRKVTEDAAFAARMAELLDVEQQTILNKLKNKNYASVVLKRQVPRATVDAIRTLRAQPAKGNYGIAGGGGAGARFIHHLLSGGAAAGHGIQPGRKAD